MSCGRHRCRAVAIGPPSRHHGRAAVAIGPPNAAEAANSTEPSGSRRRKESALAGRRCQTAALQWEPAASRGEVMRPVTDLQRRVAPFEVVTEMVPAGDQPAAIAEMERRIKAGEKDTVL